MRASQAKIVQLCCLANLWWGWGGRSIPAAVTNDLGDINSQAEEFHDHFAEEDERGDTGLRDITIADRV